VYPLHELKVVDRISPQSWRKRHGKLFKVTQILSEIYVGDIVHNIQQSHTGASIAGRLGLYE
jgi:hypothetical protein